MDSGLSPSGCPGMTASTGKSLRLIGSRILLCQPLPRKIFRFRFSEYRDYLPASRLRLRGVSRSSRTWEAGCGGREDAQRVMRRRKHLRVRRNRAVPIPRRWDQASRKTFARATVARKPGAPRRSRISRKTIARGMPVVPAALSLLACAVCILFCTQDLRVRPASGIPCALFFEGELSGITRACHAAGTRNCGCKCYACKRSANPSRRSDRRRSTRGDPSARRAPCCGSRSASRLVSPSRAA